MDLEVHAQTSIRSMEENEEMLCGVCRISAAEWDEIYGIDADADDETDEGINVKGVKNVYLPSHLGIEEHELAHSITI